MFSRSLLSSALLLLAIAVAITSTSAFTTNGIQTRARVGPAIETALSVFGKKKEEEDLSYIESRDLTREEMMEINRRNEDVMNRELGAMTGISVLFSIPMLYLCWVAFFSD
jgi:selenocysteine-specific elongation factor